MFLRVSDFLCEGDLVSVSQFFQAVFEITPSYAWKLRQHFVRKGYFQEAELFNNVKHQTSNIHTTAACRHVIYRALLSYAENDDCCLGITISPTLADVIIADFEVEYLRLHDFIRFNQMSPRFRALSSNEQNAVFGLLALEN